MSGSNSGLSLTVPGLVAVLAIVGIIVYDSGPLRTLRPPNPGLADQSFSGQRVPARLWQDPFEAAERHLKSPPSPAPAADTAPVQSQRDLTAKVWIKKATPGSDSHQEPGWQAEARLVLRDGEAADDRHAARGAAAPAAWKPWSEPRQAAVRAALPPTVLAVVPTVVPTAVQPVVPLMLPGLPLPAQAGTAPPMLSIALPTAGWARGASAESGREPAATAPAEAPRETVEQTRILAAMVDGGPYAESAESRLRARHAILAALEVSGYQPVDATHIGVFRPSGDALPLPSVVPFERLSRRNPDGSRDRIMILWLNGGAFLDEPIARIRGLIGQVSAGLGLSLPPGESVVVIGPGSSDGLAAYLREVQAAVGKAGGAGAARPGPRLDFHSATATASATSLMEEIGKPTGKPTGEPTGEPIGGATGEASGSGAAAPVQLAEDCAGPYRCDALGVSLSRDTPNDADLAASLHAELIERGLASSARQGVMNWSRDFNRWLKGFMTAADAGGEPDRGQPGGSGGDRAGGSDADQTARPPKDSKKARLVVLISEWDTLYGRALPRSVEEELTADGAEADRRPETKRGADGATAGSAAPAHPSLPVAAARGADEASATTEPREVKVRRFTYMRGLDGNLPASQGKDETQRGVSGASLVPQPRVTPPSERAEGQAQLDYLRRLAERLEAVAASSNERIFAIGILGSDLHDKMLVLQALRSKFPTTPFFTTDLDARMFDSAYASATRGLIVASGFGLNPADGDPELGRAGAASIAPFRVSYQTGLYHAVRRALPSRGSVAAAGPVPNGDPGAAPVAGPDAAPVAAADAASGAGPRAAPGAQRNAPPDAATGAVAGVSADQVRLYEIGRGGPILLAPPLAKRDDRPGTSGAADRGGRRDRSADWLLTGFWFALTFAGVWLVYWGGWKGFPRTHPLGTLGVLLLAGLLLWGLWNLFSESLLACPLHRGPMCLETLEMLDGTSGWIPVYLTFAALVLSMIFSFGLWFVRAWTLRGIERHYLAADRGADAVRSDEAEAVAFREHLRRDWDALRGLPRRLLALPGRLLGRVRRGAASGGEVAAAAGSFATAAGCADAEARGSAVCFWAGHRRYARWYWSLLRVIALGVPFSLFVSSLFPSLGGLGGDGAVRGLELRGLAGDLRNLSTLAAILLVFLYLDLAACARGLIADLAKRTVRWPDAVRTRYAVSAPGGDPALADRLIGLRVAARYADLAVRSAGYPLAVLLLLVAARLPWFDTIAMPRPVLVTVVVLAFYLLVFAWLVQHAARRLRGAVLSAYQDQLRDRRADAAALEQRRELRQLIERVEKMNDFAFKPLAENPLLKVAILPFGTLGLGLLDLLGA